MRIGRDGQPYIFLRECLSVSLLMVMIYLLYRQRPMLMPVDSLARRPRASALYPWI